MTSDGFTLGAGTGQSPVIFNICVTFSVTIKPQLKTIHGLISQYTHRIDPFGASSLRRWAFRNAKTYALKEFASGRGQNHRPTTFCVVCCLMKERPLEFQLQAPARKRGAFPSLPWGPRTLPGWGQVSAQDRTGQPTQHVPLQNVNLERKETIASTGNTVFMLGDDGIIHDA